MRKLQTKDLFSFCRCIRKIGIKDELKKIGTNAKSTNDLESLGFDFFYTLLELATEKSAEKEIYEFLSGPLEIKPSEIENMNLEILLPQIKELAQLDTWKLFFKRAVL